ncbi:MAG: hypothetical protein HQK72_03720 [Desulfamplus sp.]|nr:hypothetical protein [Desulfamplus sp.]
MDTEVGQIPVVSSKLTFKDRLQTLGARSGITRNNYKVVPGLYAIGMPDENSEVLVTSNFKLTFDILRTALQSDLKADLIVNSSIKSSDSNKNSNKFEKINAWILVLDTLGVNVWCAAGKGTFSTKELVNRVKLCCLEKVVKHRRLILPQLSATGIRAKDVKKECGFSVIYGPIRALDIPSFIVNGRKIVDPDMRQITFNFRERLILTPIELTVGFKAFVFTAAALMFISLINSGLFSLQNGIKAELINTLDRGFISILFLLVGSLSGAVITPALLPFLPFKEFAAKGIIVGAIFSFLALFISPASSLSISAMLALSLFGTAVSSWFAMNFTGATPFTSPSGVEKEMRRFIPIQAGAAFLSLVLWIYSAF